MNEPLTHQKMPEPRSALGIILPFFDALIPSKVANSARVILTIRL